MRRRWFILIVYLASWHVLAVGEESDGGRLSIAEEVECSSLEEYKEGDIKAVFKVQQRRKHERARAELQLSTFKLGKKNKSELVDSASYKATQLGSIEYSTNSVRVMDLGRHKGLISEVKLLNDGLESPLLIGLFIINGSIVEVAGLMAGDEAEIDTFVTKRGERKKGVEFDVDSVKDGEIYLNKSKSVDLSADLEKAMLRVWRKSAKTHLRVQRVYYEFNRE
jgi:hypothetical protein